MKFTNRELLTGYYRWEFLDHLETIVPGAMQDLKLLVPVFHEAFGDNIRPSGENAAANMIIAPDPGYQITDPKTLELRTGYAAFIDRYYLKTDWLRKGLFRLLLRMASWPDAAWHLSQAYSFGVVLEGDPINIEIDGWPMNQDSGEWKKAVMARVEGLLDTYIDERKNQLKIEGLKQKGKPHELRGVEWLVRWNVSDYRFLWEIIAGIDEFKDVSLRPNTKSEKKRFESIEKKLGDTFEKLAGFGLPVRPGKKLRGTK